MLRKFIYIGALVVAAAALVPAYVQQNPEAFGAVVRSFVEKGMRQVRGSRPDAVAALTEVAPGEANLPGRRVRITADRQGHYKAEFRLNGRTVTALVDTGATYVAINRSTASRIGVKLSQSDFRYRVNTANGVTSAATATIDRLEIGRIEVANVEAVVLEDSALEGTLVGLSFLNRLRRFGVEGGFLSLEQ